VSQLPLPIILDTNFIVVPADFSVDIFLEAETLLERQLEFILLPSVVQEIESKASQTKAHHKKFGIAKALFERCSIVKVNESLSELAVDDQLLEHAIASNGILATNDRELRRRARAKGVPVLFLRGKKRLVLEGSVI
jgi:rRNA-processing protein FCF1